MKPIFLVLALALGVNGAATAQTCGDAACPLAEVRGVPPVSAEQQAKLTLAAEARFERCRRDNRIVSVDEFEKCSTGLTGTDRKLGSVGGSE